MQEEKFLNVLKSRMVDGIIYVSSDYATSNKLLADLSIPVVLLTVRLKRVVIWEVCRLIIIRL